MVEIQRLAHASVLISGKNNDIYIDPYQPEDVSEDVKKLYEEPKKGDFLLITHEHHDHCDPSTFQNMLKTTSEIVAPEGCSEKIDKEFNRIEPEESIKIGDIEIQTTHAYNEKRKRDSGEPFHPKGEGVGYIITIDRVSIYHPGDTEYVPELRDINENVDLAFLPIDGTYTMNIDEAVEMAEDIEAEVVVPFHERDQELEDFKEIVEQETDIEVKILEEGKSLDLKTTL